MIRQVLIAGVLALPAFAQLQLLQFDGTTETPLAQTFNVGSGAVGDSIETRFHVRNFGTGPVTVTNLSVSGTGFKFSAQPSLPYVVAQGNFVEFKVLFAPDGLGAFNARLLVNTILVILNGTGIASAALSLGQTALAAGATIDFGATEPGTSITQTLTLSNPSPASLTVASIVVTGANFTGPVGVSAPFVLPPNQSVSFTIAFKPTSAQTSTGTLAIGLRSFKLTGLGVNPPLPKATIQFNTDAGISARQARLSIQLASPSRVAGTGSLTMTFNPAIAGVTDDAAIQFLSGAKRNATVTVNAGESIARFGTQTDYAFQTGTTAGTIVFTLKLPNDTPQATFAIPSTTAFFDLAAATRRVNDLDVSLIGFDNTHSASQLAFTFYDTSGKVLRPGTITVDKTADFNRYFTTTQAGGAFQLLASFPVTCDVLSLSLTGATNASPIQITTAKPHGYVNGDTVFIDGVTGNIAANGTWVIANLTSTTFTLTGSHGSGNYTSGSGAVTGPCTNVAGVEVEMTNSAGVAKTQRISF